MAEDTPSAVIASLRLHQFINAYVLPRYDIPIIDYEEYVGHDRELLVYLADKMGICLTEGSLSEAAEFLSVDRIRTISAGLASADLDTFVQPDHVSATLGQPGGGLSELPADLIYDLKQWGHWPTDIQRRVWDDAGIRKTTS